eukprot:7729351-Pyramimonas_sp.AAC.1
MSEPSWAVLPRREGPSCCARRVRQIPLSRAPGRRVFVMFSEGVLGRRAARTEQAFPTSEHATIRRGRGRPWEAGERDYMHECVRGANMSVPL